MLGALIGEAIAAGDMEQARHLAWTISRKYADMPLPAILKLYPELQGDTKLAGAAADAKYTGVEDTALEEMMKRANGGMGPEDQANLMKARLGAENEAQAQMGALDREGRRRGMAGSSLVGKGVAAQQGANRLSQAGVLAAGDASQRALQALGMGSQYASNLAGRSLAQANLVGSARDRISEFNLGRKDRADEINQKIPQQQFENAMSKTSGETEGLKLLIDQYGAKGQSARRASRAAGGAVGTAIGSIAGG
jgi:hypothetical protein